MKNTFKSIIKDAEWDAGYERCCTNTKLPYKILLARAIIYSTLHTTYHNFIENHICSRFGHRWVDESYGGPDSGCMAGTCSRCGASFHTQLY